MDYQVNKNTIIGDILRIRINFYDNARRTS